jgi:hypothetical protein
LPDPGEHRAEHLDDASRVCALYSSMRVQKLFSNPVRVLCALCSTRSPTVVKARRRWVLLYRRAVARRVQRH